MWGGGTYLSACSRRKIVFLDRIYQSNSSCSRVGCRVLLGLCKTRPCGEQPGSRPAGAQGRVRAGRARPRRRVPEASFLAPPLARRRPAGTCLGGRSPAAPAAPPGTTQRASANVRANKRLALPALWRLSRLCVSCASAGPGAASRGAARGARGRLCPFTPSFGRRVVSRKRRPGGRRTASRGAWGAASAAGRAAPCICGGQGWDGEAPSAAASAPGFLLPGSLESPLVGCHRRGGGRGHPHPPRGSLSQRANGSSLLRPPRPHTCPHPPRSPAAPGALTCPAAHLPGLPCARGGPSCGSDLPGGLHRSRPVLSWPLPSARNFVFVACALSQLLPCTPLLVYVVVPRSIDPRTDQRRGARNRASFPETLVRTTFPEAVTAPSDQQGRFLVGRSCPVTGEDTGPVPRVPCHLTCRASTSSRRFKLRSDWPQGQGGDRRAAGETREHRAAGRVPSVTSRLPASPPQPRRPRSLPPSGH